MNSLWRYSHDRTNVWCTSDTASSSVARCVITFLAAGVTLETYTYGIYLYGTRYFENTNLITARYIYAPPTPIHTCLPPRPAHTCYPPLYSTPPPPRVHGTLRFVQVMPAWSAKLRRAPSRYCRGTRVGHTTTAIDDNEYSPRSPALPGTYMPPLAPECTPQPAVLGSVRYFRRPTCSTRCWPTT